MSKRSETLLRSFAPVLVTLLIVPAAHSTQNESTGAVTAALKSEKKGMQPGGYYGSQPTAESVDLSMYERIRSEATAHGQGMAFASALCDGVGPRLTGSPNLKRANDWTRDTLAKVGLTNAHLEDWGEFGRGWYQSNTWGRIVTPDPGTHLDAGSSVVSGNGRPPERSYRLYLASRRQPS